LTDSPYGEIVVGVEDDLDEMLRALAHPARRAVLHRCVGEWVAAGDLAGELDLAPATVSEHLKVLRKVGFVELQIDGTWRRYRSVPSRIDEVTQRLAEALPQPTVRSARKARL
jgi:DNA-binding transcriptional ArsR family regulator